MMNNEPWVLMDTETSGITEPIHVIGLAAQRMRGWEPEGVPFQKLVNRAVDIPAQTTRINGYTRDRLERDGEPVSRVYAAFRSYCGGLPLVSWDLAFDLDRALMPEWGRLEIAEIGRRGFCLQRLAQRLLDPLPAASCRLGTLAEYYDLPEPSLAAAPGALDTIRSLLGMVLRPVVQERGLATFEQVRQFVEEEWFPTLLPFGKFRGRSFREAHHDPALRDWIAWLSGSTVERSARMGAWYLKQLAKNDTTEPDRLPGSLRVPATLADSVRTNTAAAAAQRLGEPDAGLVIYRNPERERVQELVRLARERLAELEAVHARVHNTVSMVRARLFSLLEEDYRERDRLALIVKYRRRFVDTLYTSGEDGTDDVREEYAHAQENQEQEYQETRELSRSRKTLTDAEQREIRTIYRQLNSLYHPDRHTTDPDKCHAYGKLMQDINAARDREDIQTLREIAQDPSGWLERKGFGKLDFSEESRLDRLLKIYQDLQVRIVMVLEKVRQLRSDPDHELARLSERRRGYLEEVAADLRQDIRRECETLAREAAELDAQIEAMTGSPAAHWQV